MGLVEDIRRDILAAGNCTTAAEYAAALHAAEDDLRFVLALRLMWECGMATTEICSMRKVNVNPWARTITVAAEGYVPPWSARVVKVDNDEIFDLIAAETKRTGTGIVIQQKYKAAVTGKFVNPDDFMKQLSSTILRKTGIKVTLRSLFRGKFVYMADHGVTEMYQMLRFFGSENLSKLGIMQMGEKLRIGQENYG